MSKSFDQLFDELTKIAAERPAGSGTAAEVWMASEYETLDMAAEEISQLLYWCQVMMVKKGLSLEDVYRHL